MFLPGTYGTALIRNHSLNGVMESLSSTLPPEAIKGLKDSIDCNIYFFDNNVEIGTMYLVMSLTIVLLISAYVLINKFCKKIKN